MPWASGRDQRGCNAWQKWQATRKSKYASRHKPLLYHGTTVLKRCYACLQVMESEGGLFHGDMQQRSSQTMPFREFLGSAPRPSGDDESAPGPQLYLAQVPAAHLLL